MFGPGSFVRRRVVWVPLVSLIYVLGVALRFYYTESRSTSVIRATGPPRSRNANTQISQIITNWTNYTW